MNVVIKKMHVKSYKDIFYLCKYKFSDISNDPNKASL